MSLTVLVAVLSLGPEVTGGPALPVSDKILHAVAYAALTVAWLVAAPRRNAVVVALGVCGYGVILELAQIALPERTGSAWDVVANLSGIMIGAVAGRLLVRIRRARAAPRG